MLTLRRSAPWKTSSRREWRSDNCGGLAVIEWNRRAVQAGELHLKLTISDLG